jgi:hypothetical protein
MLDRDFESFKEVMLEYKREATQGGLGLGLTCHAMKVSHPRTTYSSCTESGDKPEALS